MQLCLLLYTIRATFELTYNSSSRVNKTNIVDLPYDTSVLYNVQPREYLSLIDNKHYVGFIAEELHDVEPLFAHYNEQGICDSVE